MKDRLDKLIVEVWDLERKPVIEKRPEIIDVIKNTLIDVDYSQHPLEMEVTFIPNEETKNPLGILISPINQDDIIRSISSQSGCFRTSNSIKTVFFPTLGHYAVGIYYERKNYEEALQFLQDMRGSQETAEAL
tara:strand:+ start:70 stop:468 length:399 start_codon:yes stop_codon:yes gene_type:complete